MKREGAGGVVERSIVQPVSWGEGLDAAGEGLSRSSGSSPAADSETETKALGRAFRTAGVLPLSGQRCVYASRPTGSRRDVQGAARTVTSNGAGSVAFSRPLAFASTGASGACPRGSTLGRLRLGRSFCRVLYPRWGVEREHAHGISLKAARSNSTGRIQRGPPYSAPQMRTPFDSTLLKSLFQTPQDHGTPTPRFIPDRYRTMLPPHFAACGAVRAGIIPTTPPASTREQSANARASRTLAALTRRATARILAATGGLLPLSLGRCAARPAGPRRTPAEALWFPQRGGAAPRTVHALSVAGLPSNRSHGWRGSRGARGRRRRAGSGAGGGRASRGASRGEVPGPALELRRSPTWPLT